MLQQAASSGIAVALHRDTKWEVGSALEALQSRCLPGGQTDTLRVHLRQKVGLSGCKQGLRSKCSFAGHCLSYRQKV